MKVYIRKLVEKQHLAGISYKKSTAAGAVICPAAVVVYLI
jgi:hypothetical protein